MTKSIGEGNYFRWSCDKKGCFNKYGRPKLEVFEDCFSLGAKLSDIDSTIEVDGNFLTIEFKSFGKSLPKGQEIMFRRKTKPGRNEVVLVLECDPVTMALGALTVFSDGKPKAIGKVSLDKLRRWLADWDKRSRLHPNS